MEPVVFMIPLLTSVAVSACVMAAVYLFAGEPLHPVAGFGVFATVLIGTTVAMNKAGSSQSPADANWWNEDSE